MLEVERCHALLSPDGRGVARWPRAWAELATEAVMRINGGRP
jgi:hypothetical protein